MSEKDKAEASMQERIAKLKDDLSGVRTGRANPAMVDHIKVEYYGSMVPIKQVAAVSVPEPRTLELRPWDANALDPLDKALQKSDLGVPTQNDGKVIRLNFPTMTEERRKDLSKQVGKIGEEYRVSIRSDRKDAMDAIKKRAKAENLPEDQVKAFEGAIQKLTDKFVADVDALIEEKQKEVTTV
ncbi:MAG: ribosome recycling factor [Elusimicrobia bacterium CG1_02_63_36]|nr:MAG: ribosome recycling factor [Elusimicrobia bacterium CG1_02_63_36]PIP82437.1 MAG: ribosome recycling factor [Elusimicrobia bacterium CG22_combo_CG10-13_8_21_14_all_63_91]PJA17888.1 MAG: ribosome recycling factor [Elusimicrobia bacterium CG_4_10_14_0_2_um_filter_63_34]PJB26586.1 MAG: ribosome recycling factor [Elusimicrobia bacterium CG_4_9_14_3_um_filter_62_55]